MNTVPTFEQQVELEKEMQKVGYDRYLKNTTKAVEYGRESGTAPVISIIKRGIDPVAELLTKRFEVANSGKAGKRVAAVSLLEGISPPDVIAFVAVRTIFDTIHKDPTLQTISITIGSALEVEKNLINLEAADENRFKATHGHLKRRRHMTAKHLRRAVFMHAVRESEKVEREAWSTKDRYMVGQYLVDLVSEASGLFTVVSRCHMTKKGLPAKAYFIQATPECLSWIDERHERLALLSPSFMPCVIEPRPWTGVWEGGYHTEAIQPISLIKSSERAYLQEVDEIIKSGGMVEVIDAINTMQKTAWAVNTQVLEVMHTIFENQGSTSIAGLPARDRQELPPCPICGANIEATSRRNPHPCLEAHPEALAGWRKDAAIIHLNNAALFSTQIQFRRMISIADRYREFERFYFPYQMDFRGRVYAIPSGLTPQGTKASKGLLHFTEGKAIGTEDALRWFMIHGANTHGEDKIPFDERVAWVQENEERILSCAADPITDLWWADADSPWCFLAWCFEYAGFKAEGLGFKSRIPIAMDGSCNGIQIFSLILRDPEGAKAVNVLPSEKPQDVYAEVANRTIEKLKYKLVEGETEVRRKKLKDYEEEPAVLYNEREEAKKWLDLGINRKATKRQVMVLPYGGTGQSCREYTQDYLQDQINAGYKWEGNPFMSSVFLSALIWDSINETVSAPQAAMRYLQKVSSIVTSEGLPTNWTTPTGLPVMQRYRSLENVRITTKMGESLIKVSLALPTDEIDASRQRSAISPNYVHSLDAAALQRTVYRAFHEHGIKDYAMIHDSYGTHAADTPALARTLREVFVDMFGGDRNLLQEFTEEVTRVIHDPKKLGELPELPALGSLEVDKVLESEFFFA